MPRTKKTNMKLIKTIKSRQQRIDIAERELFSYLYSHALYEQSKLIGINFSIEQDIANQVIDNFKRENKNLIIEFQFNDGGYDSYTAIRKINAENKMPTIKIKKNNKK